ncbi:uncharacterized protein LOC133192358 [Saccostrea echinata]|uniref:uncharacterized protein LOC133192358 n=1 Tax=Saccostrea echinata TaxID=191078 RepID=UPI002A7FC004|nr:uncharacterized protein LOC133192358 [Saccostrea echinata]
MSFPSNFSRSFHPSYTSSPGFDGKNTLSHKTASGLSNNLTTGLNLNPHGDDISERSRSPYSITNYRSYLDKDIKYGTSQSNVQQSGSIPGTAQRLQMDLPETHLHTSSSASNLEHVENDLLEDPRSPIRKLLDFMQDIHDVDIERCLRDYKAMMESRDPTALTREEEYVRSKKSLTEVVDKRSESRCRRERDQFRNERDQLQKEVDELHAKVTVLEKMEKEFNPSEALGKEIEKIKQEYEEKNRELNDKWKKALEKKGLEEMEKETKLKEDIEKLQKQLEEKQKMESKLLDRVERHKKALDQAHEEKDKLEKEKTEALTRLSKEMGNKLNDKNPNITDLSDSNRPTKIAEKYNELYDNEWTDALEHLSQEIYTEESAIVELLDCIQAAYSFCKDAAFHQMENLKKSLTNLRIRSRDASNTLCTVEPQTEKMLEEIRKSQKMPSDSLFKEFEYSSGFKTVFKKVPEYTSKCLELCWLMHMQNPPVALGQPPAEGSPFNGNMYKEYTKTGNTVHFVVWLPLLLQENGPLLQKGVAQPYPNKDRSIRQRSPSAADNIKKSTYQVDERARQTTGTSDPLVDQMFDNQGRNVVTTGQTRTHREIPISIANTDRGSYEYMYGNRHQSATPTYQQSIGTARTSTASPKYDNTHRQRTHHTSSTSQGSRSRVRESHMSDTLHKYTEPYLFYHNGEKYVHFQGKTFPYNIWQAMERKFWLDPGSSEA